MKAVFGLGNPKKRYHKSRHNVGFMVVSSLGEDVRIKIKRRRFSAKTGIGEVDGEKVLLALPQTYMNRSGISVSKALDFFRLSQRDIIVVYDDMDLDFGRLRIRKGGSSGGHRGVQSIIDYIDSKDFIRLKLGIGRPGRGAGWQGDPVDFVLGPFSPAEEDVLQDMIDRAKEAILTIMQKGVDFSMNRFNM